MGKQTKQDEMAKRREAVLRLLLERPYTYDELAEKLEQSARNIKYDIKALQESGYEIPKHKKGVGYVIPEEKKDEYLKSLDGSFLFLILTRTSLQACCH